MSYVDEDDIVVEREAMETLCGHRSIDEEAPQPAKPPALFLGCVVVAVITIIAVLFVLGVFLGGAWEVKA